MIHVFWGVKGLAKDGGSQWDSSFIGKAIMDEKFDMSQEDAQKSVLNICKELKE